MYAAGGGRDVLIVAPDPSLTHPEAVARRPGQLTEKDKQTLQRQGVPPDSCQNEVLIIKARHDLDKKQKIVEVKSGQSLSREEVMKSIAHLLITTENDGGKDISIHTDTKFSSFVLRPLPVFLCYTQNVEKLGVAWG